MERFVISTDNLKTVQRFNLTHPTREFNIKPISSDIEPAGWIKDVITQIFGKGADGISLLFFRRHCI